MEEHVCQCRACAPAAYPAAETWEFDFNDPGRDTWHGQPPWRLWLTVNGERRYAIAATPGVVGVALSLPTTWPLMYCCKHDCPVAGFDKPCELLEYGNVQIGHIRKDEP